MSTGVTAFFLENYFLPIFRGLTVAAPDSFTLELTSDVPDASGVATPLASGSAPGYAPVTIDAIPANWEFIDPRTLGNKNRIFFPKATTGSWPSVMGWLLKDNLANTLAFGHVSQGRIIDATQRFKVEPRDLTIRIPNVKKYVADIVCNKVLSLFQGVNINGLISFNLDFGTKDPTNTGDIGKLAGSGYAPIVVNANATEMGEPAARMISNLIEFGPEDDRVWTTATDIETIKGVEISVDNTPWMRGVISNTLSLKEKDNPRLPINSLVIKG